MRTSPAESRGAPWTLLAAAALVCTLGAGCTQRQTSALTHSAVYPLSITFLYLPDSAITRIRINADTLQVHRTTADSTTTDFSLPRTGAIATLIDSAVTILRRIPGTTYEKRGVLDGTVMTITSHDYHLECRNCLNDYVMELAGRPLPPQSKPVRDLKLFTTRITEILLRFEPRENTAEQTRRRLGEIEHLYRERYNRTIQFALDTTRSLREQ